MKNLVLLLFISFVSIQLTNGQVTGFWKSTDHVDATEKSVVEIYEKDGKYFGRVDKLLPAATVTHCTGCTGDQKNKSIVGMLILIDVDKTENGGENGKILDPSNGKFYSCDIKLVSPDKLEVTGYVGFPMLGKTMVWKRLSEK